MRFPVFAVYLDKRKLATYTILAFVLGSLLGGAMWNFGGVFIPELPPSNLLTYGSLLKFTSEAELVNFLETMSTGNYWEYGGLKGRGFVSILSDDIAGLASDASVSSQNAPDFSGTNIQVEGVDEADMVKTDGEFIYLASGKRVFIVKAFPPGDAEVLATLELDREASDLFINGDKLVVISSPQYYYYWGPMDILPPEEY
ncbi:hypothetical protein E3J39_00595, partial [Candidatus Bathyarchaeota archaeon]